MLILKTTKIIPASLKKRVREYMKIRKVLKLQVLEMPFYFGFVYKISSIFLYSFKKGLRGAGGSAAG